MIISCRYPFCKEKDVTGSTDLCQEHFDHWVAAHTYEPEEIERWLFDERRKVIPAPGNVEVKMPERKVEIICSYSKHNRQVGTFHGFFQSGDAEYDFNPVAIIEIEDGTVVQMSAHQIKFVKEDPQ
jgi:hypothetical protein